MGSGEKDIIEELLGFPINHFIHAVEEARKNQGAKLDRFVADVVVEDIHTPRATPSSCAPFR